MSNSNNRRENTNVRLTFAGLCRANLRIFAVLAIAILLLGSSILIQTSSALTNNGSITSFGSPLTENFDTLASTGTGIVWTDNTTIPGWYSSRVAYNSGTGSSNTGALYSFGLTGDRALGSVGSGSTGTIYWGVKLTNNTGGTITSLDINYVGEQWRNGGALSPAVSVAQTADFQYQVADPGTITGINSPTTGWQDHDALDFTSPTFGTTAAAALDGNAAANRTAKSSTISVTINNGQEVWLRWRDIDHAGNDHGLSVDDLSVTANGSTSTNPSGVGAANPSSVSVGSSSLLTVAVTPGTGPDSTGLTVSANLSAIGGSSNQTFFDNGTNGDATAGDNTFSYTATVSVGTSGGLKNLPATVTDAEARSGNANIALTVLAPTNPSGTGSATPNSVLAGQGSTLSVNVTPGTEPTSTGLAVTADLTSIGGVANQQFFDDATNGDTTPGDNIFSYLATVTVGTTPGVKNLPFNITDAETRSGSGSISLTVQSPPPPSDHVVISQIYGGGGNSGATYLNDYVELYNPSPTTFNLNGWSVQYASATGSGWASGTVPLAGPIAPGEYYLVKLASGGAVGLALPEANAEGSVNMAAGSGKIALVNNAEGLTGSVATCPLEDPNLVDFVGYGTTANCREGTANAPLGTNTTALLRNGNGTIDTNQNGDDFTAGAPNPRRTAIILDAPPSVSSTDTDSDPFASTPAPRDASVAVFFSEPVEVIGTWYAINCVNTGAHTAVVSAGPRNWVLTPDVNFQPGEQCTIQIFAANVRDLDTDDSEPNTDFMQADYSANFTVAAAAPAPYDSSVHLTFGNPSGAITDINQPNNYLLEKPEFSLSYNRDRGTPNWVAWHLSDDWTGSLTRIDTFRPDPELPAEWNRVNQFDYTGSGFDRGHMTPSADRLANLPLNQATFLMNNIIPQAPFNNQQTWNFMEQDLRDFTPANELYIVSGGAGIGGRGANGVLVETIAGGRITVPEYVWKVVLIIPKGDDDISRVTCGARTIAVIVPNTNTVSSDWMQYITTVHAVEQLTGYDFFANLPDAVEYCVEAGTNGTNPPGTEGQSVTTDEDTPKSITMTAASPGNPLTYTIVSGPTSGELTGSGASQTYTPAANYCGSDSFTFKVNDGNSDSNTSTVNITVTCVNDPPVAVGDSYSTDVNTQLAVSAPGVLENDSDPVEGSSITAVLVSDVSDGQLTLNADGSFTYNPDAGFTGTDSFTYKANDGDDDSNVVTVSIAVNDDEAPVLSSSIATTLLTATNSNLFNVGLTASATDNSGEAVTIQVTVYGDEDDQTPTLSNIVHSPDAKDLAPITLRLRGERVEANNGRVYLIVVTATDTSGNVSRNYHAVVVPKSNKAANVDMAIAEGAAAKAYAETNGVPPPGYFTIGDGPVIGPKQ